MINIGNVNLLNGGEDIVHLTTIDDMHMEEVHMIKIDVKGMEHEVILGATRTITESQPVLFVENNNEERSSSLLEALLNFEYRLYWHFALYFNNANYFENTFNIFVERPEINVLALPESKSNLVAPNLEPVVSIHDTWEEAYNRARQNGRSYIT